jgi:hypothetical protein
MVNGKLRSYLRVCLGMGLLSLSLLGLAGCGANGKLHGKVTYQGTAFPEGTVLVFHHDKTDHPYTTEVKDGGTYFIDKLPKGKYLIAVQTHIGTKTGGMSGFDASVTQGKSSFGPAKDAKDVIAPPGSGLTGAFAKDPNAGKFLIDPKYMDPKTSPLSVEVTGGDQTQDIDVP